MSLEESLQAILKQQVIVRPKPSSTYEELLEVYGQALDSQDAWLIPCTHKLNPPAGLDDLALVEQKVAQTIPEELSRLLLVANGIKLYVAPTLIDGDYVEYPIFSTEELAYWNQQMYEVFRSSYQDDPELCNVRVPNYIAFCDAHDDNYLAIVTTGPYKGRIFFLNHELAFRPYNEQDSQFYFTVTESLEAWLEVIWKTKGLGGFGHEYLTYRLTGELPEW